MRGNAPGILICGHGSADPAAADEFARLCAAVAGYLPDVQCAAACLEFVPPTIGQGLEGLVQRGAGRIAVVPAMLFAGRHVTTDLPREIDYFNEAHPALDIRLGDPIGLGRGLVETCFERVADAEAAAARAVARHDTLLLVIGRGARAARANAEAAAAAHGLAAALGFARHAIAFAANAEPGLETALEHAASGGASRVIVLPMLLFAGTLLRRVADAVGATAARHPGLDWRLAGHIGAHPALARTLAESAAGLLGPAS